MEWNRRRAINPSNRLPIFLRGIKIPAISVHKFLRVLIDQELCWKDQVNYTLQKGSMWVTQYRWLARLSGFVQSNTCLSANPNLPPELR